MIVRHRLTPTLAVTPAQIDRTFGQLVNSLFDTPAFGPNVRADWHDDEYVLTVDLPGVPAEAVTVEVTGQSLRLAATSGESQWSRTLRLGGSLDPDKVSARHVDGRLTVRIGKFDEPAARQVAIDTTPATPAIDAGEPVDAQSSEASSAG
ncbi:MAG TPA: Hsp20/alpha crystallin family protein [Ilumatobacter sp.]|nr:Hsp20/alpha crystallin family protein [Ilumatobacter sp.]